MLLYLDFLRKKEVSYARVLLKYSTFQIFCNFTLMQTNASLETLNLLRGLKINEIPETTTFNLLTILRIHA